MYSCQALAIGIAAILIASAWHLLTKIMNTHRILDLATSAFGLIVLSPLFIALALIIRLYDGGTVFYRAPRIGKNGVPFRLFKFRSMVVNADRTGQVVTTNGDSRITPIGRFLRRTKIDELPQLLNVLKGEMSLVGPRPESPKYVGLYTPAQRAVLQVLPGITSAASLTFRHEEQLLSGDNWEDVYRNEVLPAKLAIDLNYLSQRTLMSDVGLILQTVKAMFN